MNLFIYFVRAPKSNNWWNILRAKHKEKLPWPTIIITDISRFSLSMVTFDHRCAFLILQIKTSAYFEDEVWRCTGPHCRSEHSIVMWVDQRLVEI